MTEDVTLNCICGGIRRKKLLKCKAKDRHILVGVVEVEDDNELCYGSRGGYEGDNATQPFRISIKRTVFY
jgi:hypothetical protein